MNLGEINYGVEIDEDQVGAVDSSWCGLASSFVVDLYDAGRRFGSGISRRALIDMMLGERSGYAI